VNIGKLCDITVYVVRDITFRDVLTQAVHDDHLINLALFTYFNMLSFQLHLTGKYRKDDI